ncbi:AAA domain-containing protein [Flectobacillus roseus]|uniref:AAA domain-containing protein n=1 Tax=Flectobacillus roseus TaxID=502259 RepID=UPI0024B80B9A|nr:AAA domain-containing protein [Flectobacillus roseus]MDI9868485.1 AAA domain-containing protein [Flectobacillus roseus]
MIDYSLQTILKAYAKRLTNLSAKNKSLLLLNLPNEQFIDLHELDFLHNQPSFMLIEQLIAQKNAISLCDTLDPRNVKVNEVSKRLKKISRTEKFIEEERGAKDLYVGYPMVKGKLMDGTVVRCPLLFFPVTLTQKAQRLSLNSSTDTGSGIKWHLQRREEPVTFNRSFLLAYSHFNEIKIFDNFLEYTFEDFSKTSLEFRTQLYELLKVSPLNVNFNQELFTNQLQYFEKSTKADLEQIEKNGELKLYPQAVLGIFPQAGSFLVPDYDFLIEESQNNITGLFREGEAQWLHPSLSMIQPTKIREEKLLTPLAIDASQEEIIREVKIGKSLVVQGPPGTGKSQLICNLVADFTARGKSVLVVSQKRAALDVVYERLRQIGMEQFVGSVHDFKNDRKALYSQILHQVEQIDAYKKHNYSLDSIFLERSFDQESRRIDKIVEELDSFKTALFDTSLCGVSVKELYLTSQPDAPYVDLSNFYQDYRFDQLDDFLTRFQKYCQYTRLFRHDSIGKNFWNKRKRFNSLTFSDVKHWQELFSKTFKATQTVFQELESLLESKIQYDDLQNLIQERDELKSISAILTSNSYFDALKYRKQQKHSLRALEFSQLFEQIKAIFGVEGIEITLDSSALKPFLHKLIEALDAKSNAIGGMVWSLFSKQKKDIQDVVVANGLTMSADDLRRLQMRIQNRIQLEEWWTEFGHLFWVKSQGNISSERPIWLGKGFRWFERHFEMMHKAIQTDMVWQETHLSLLVDISSFDYESVKNLLEDIHASLEGYAEAHVYSQPYLSESQLEMLANIKASEASDIIAYLDEHFDLMLEADEIHRSFSTREMDLISLLEEEANLEDSPIELFTNNLKLAWIEAIEQRYPILRGASTLKLQQLEEDLQKSIEQKQQLSKEILQLKLREKTYQSIEVNRLQNVTTYRDLKHQVSKKRKIWSIRKLIAELSDEVFNLIPCWLASPETVSAIFPLTTHNLAISEKNSTGFHPVIFDLVIFDEASQCYAEQGIPSIFRGKQTVIAGDSKQLQPSDLYRIRFDDEDEDIPALEVDSFLDLGCQFLPQMQLRGHYRSRSLDLIDFSNQHFYQNSLQLLPRFEDMNDSDSSIEYIQVSEGIWNNHCNAVEADVILTLVKELRANTPDKSIGIVTFNYRQQVYIQDLLEQHLHAQEKLTKNGQEPIFVKNIENVQGDERDIIIFSVGYAPDASGRFTMNFGALNMSGGENRLNVAVTRARERVYVITSIAPEQLKVEDATHEGPKLLKQYLEYARRVSEGLYSPQPHISKNYWAEWLLKEQLSKKVVSFVKELPFADLTIKSAQQYQGVVLTDDDLFYDARSVKESFAYLPLELQRKGWSFTRYYSRQLWKKVIP